MNVDAIRAEEEKKRGVQIKAFLYRVSQVNIALIRRQCLQGSLLGVSAVGWMQGIVIEMRRYCG